MTTNSQQITNPCPRFAESDAAGMGQKAVEHFKVEGTESVDEITTAIRNMLHSVFCASIDVSMKMHDTDDISSNLIVAEGLHVSFATAREMASMGRVQLEMAQAATDEDVRAQLKCQTATEWAAAAVERYRNAAEACLTLTTQQARRLDESRVANNRTSPDVLQATHHMVSVMLNAARERLLLTCEGGAT